MRGRRPLDRMELQSRGPCTRTCSSSTASSSAIQCPFRTASPPPAASLLRLPPPRRRAPPGARAIASTLSDLAGSRSVPGERCLRRRAPYGGPCGGERVAHVALRGPSRGDPTDGFDSQGALPAMERAHERGRLTAPPPRLPISAAQAKEGKDTPCLSLRHRRCRKTFCLQKSRRSFTRKSISASLHFF